MSAKQHKPCAVYKLVGSARLNFGTVKDIATLQVGRERGEQASSVVV